MSSYKKYSGLSRFDDCSLIGLVDMQVIADIAEYAVMVGVPYRVAQACAVADYYSLIERIHRLRNPLDYFPLIPRINGLRK